MNTALPANSSFRRAAIELSLIAIANKLLKSQMLSQEVAEALSEAYDTQLTVVHNRSQGGAEYVCVFDAQGRPCFTSTFGGRTPEVTVHNHAFAMEVARKSLEAIKAQTEKLTNTEVELYAAIGLRRGEEVWSLRGFTQLPFKMSSMSIRSDLAPVLYAKKDGRWYNVSSVSPQGRVTVALGDGEIETFMHEEVAIYQQPAAGPQLDNAQRLRMLNDLEALSTGWFPVLLTKGSLRAPIGVLYYQQFTKGRLAGTMCCATLTNIDAALEFCNGVRGQRQRIAGCLAESQSMWNQLGIVATSQKKL